MGSIGLNLPSGSSPDRVTGLFEVAMGTQSRSLREAALDELDDTIPRVSIKLLRDGLKPVLPALFGHSDPEFWLFLSRRMTRLHHGLWLCLLDGFDLAPVAAGMSQQDLLARIDIAATDPTFLESAGIRRCLAWIAWSGNLTGLLEQIVLAGNIPASDVDRYVRYLHLKTPNLLAIFFSGLDGGGRRRLLQLAADRRPEIFRAALPAAEAIGDLPEIRFVSEENLPFFLHVRNLRTFNEMRKRIRMRKIAQPK